jgi:hypothetical protein
MPDRWTSDPIPAVMAIPMQPPRTTRRVGVSTGEPDVLALTTPVTTKPPTANVTILQACDPGVGAKAPRKGMRPPIIKLVAEAIEAEPREDPYHAWL